MKIINKKFAHSISLSGLKQRLQMWNMAKSEARHLSPHTITEKICNDGNWVCICNNMVTLVIAIELYT